MPTSTSSEISFFRPLSHVDCEIAIGTLPFLYQERVLELDSEWPQYFLRKLRDGFGVNRIVCIGSDAEYFSSRLPKLEVIAKSHQVDLIRLPVLGVSGFSELSFSSLRSLSSFLAQSNGEIGRTLLLCSLDGERSTTLAGAVSICLGSGIDSVLSRLRMLRLSAFSNPTVEKFLRALHEYAEEQKYTADSITWEFNNSKVFHAGNAADFFSSSEMDIILSSDRTLVPVDLTHEERHRIANSTFELHLAGSNLAKQLNLELKPLYIEPGAHSSYLKALIPAAMDVYDPSAGFVTYTANPAEGTSGMDSEGYVDADLNKIQGLMEALGLFCATAQVHYRCALPMGRKKTTRAILAGPMRSSRAAEFALMYKIDGFLFSPVGETSRYINCRVHSTEGSNDFSRRVIY
tara:strand:- start:5368 stop:6579 length:1212 start_codon:yes stop_codon:yes gene_type:complete